LLVVVLVVGLALRVAILVAGGASGAPPLAAAVRHLAGIAVAVGAYVVLRRWGVWPWLAVLAVLPAHWDGRVLAAEQSGGAGVLVLVLVSLALVAACWWSRPPPLLLVGAGALVAAAIAVLVATEPSAYALPAAGTDAAWVRALLRVAEGVELSPPLLVLGALVAAAAAAGAGRAGASSMRLVCALSLVLPLALLALDLTRGRSAAGLLPVVAWWPVAAALGTTALLRGRRSPAASLPQHDAVDDQAAEDFDRRYRRPVLAPVTVVIAAYHEEDGLPAVLAALPSSVCDLAVDVLVVDDGSSDGTAAVVEADPRARVVRCGTNRGQGAALRLGYRIAREHGARYVVTTDADGQYDVSDIASVLRPLLDGRADFVTGSRLLGHQHTQDRVRRAGVHVFAWLLSALVGRRVTDTSFGLRAMRAEVTAAVTLNQPQYQSSELLIGVLSHGFRVLEVPATMHTRTAGSSKKGRNLVYGSRYARVVLGTWWREGCPRPVAATAPAVREGGRR
jgi:hypothetical protein